MEEKNFLLIFLGGSEQQGKDLEIWLWIAWVENILKKINGLTAGNKILIA